jgi:hypothetical protein
MKKALFVILGLLVLAACASAFPYKWYGIDPGAGVLLGKTPKDDLPISVCSPDDVQKGKCAVMLVDEFDRLRNDYTALKERLKACEKK